MQKPVRLAIAGLGLVGRRHADAIDHVSDVALVGAIDPSAEGQASAKERATPCFASLEEFFANDSADGVILATPNALHVEHAMTCIANQCAALVEKPLATDVAAAELLVDAAEAADVPLLVGHHRRHNPIIARAKAAIEAGDIGDVRSVQSTCWFYKPDSYFDAAPWRTQPGAGPISVNLVHDIDLLRHLCGEIVAVIAKASPSARGHANEDVASALLEFENGAIGTITVSDSIVAPWSWELTSREYPIYPPTSESCYLIGGSHGSLSLPDLRVWHHSGGERNWWSPIAATSQVRSSTDPLVNQIQNFAAVIAGSEDALVTGREGLQTLRVIEGIQRSALEGVRVETIGEASFDHPRAVKNI